MSVDSPIVERLRQDGHLVVYRQRRVHAGVILLRLAGLSPLAKSEIVSTVIREHGAEFVGALSVVSGGMIRIRRRV